MQRLTSEFIIIPGESILLLYIAHLKGHLYEIFQLFFFLHKLNVHRQQTNTRYHYPEVAKPPGNDTRKQAKSLNIKNFTNTQVQKIRNISLFIIADYCNPEINFRVSLPGNRQCRKSKIVKNKITKKYFLNFELVKKVFVHLVIFLLYNLPFLAPKHILKIAKNF